MENLKLIKTKSELKDLVAYLGDFEFVAYDTETTGLHTNAEVIGVSVCTEPDKAFYVVLSRWDVPSQQLVRLETLETIRELIEALSTKKLVMHNAVFDCRVTTKNFGIELMPAVHTDTMILAHLLDENRPVGLKDLAFTQFGDSATEEQSRMKESVITNGGSLTKKLFELYKADPDLIGLYGAKDTLLTLQLFYRFVPELYEAKLEKFFYEEESMPLLRGPTYKLNTTGLKVDMEKIKLIEEDLRAECLRLESEILTAIKPYVKETYPGTSEKNTFNLNSNEQLSWLLFIKLNNHFKKLTPKGKELAQEYMGKVPYNPSGKAKFVKMLRDAGKKPEKYIQCDSNAMANYAGKYTWISKLLEYKKTQTLLKTYAIGLQAKVEYGIIHPSFLQHGTTSGRYASNSPNFQNLPRKDKRIRSCIVARPGKVFVGADYSQLEPRIFASFAKDVALLKGFESKEDFYSVIGIPVFSKFEATADKDKPTSFNVLYPVLRDISKVIALSATYGTTAYKLSDTLRDEEGQNLTIDACQKILDDYFENYPGVSAFMKESHEIVKKNGVVYNLFGRPRRIPDAKKVNLYKGVAHHELPYQLRTLLNLSVNYRIQSTAASIMNRAAILFDRLIQESGLNASVVLQVHDELIAETDAKNGEQVAKLLKQAMESVVQLPGVKLIADPKIASNLADLK